MTHSLRSKAAANVEGEAAAAKAAGINFYNIPFSGQSPDPKVADQFLATITATNKEPAFIHGASGNRAGAMWMIKRLVVDHWDTDKAFTEATALGLTSPALKQFAIDYAQTRRRGGACDERPRAAGDVTRPSGPAKTSTISSSSGTGWGRFAPGTLLA